MHGIVQRNLVTRVKGNEESTYRQGDVNLTPADLGAVNKDFSIYSIASTPYTGSELIPMRAGSDNVYTSINTLASQIGGGSLPHRGQRLPWGSPAFSDQLKVII